MNFCPQLYCHKDLLCLMKCSGTENLTEAIFLLARNLWITLDRQKTIGIIYFLVKDSTRKKIVFWFWAEHNGQNMFSSWSRAEKDRPQLLPYDVWQCDRFRIRTCKIKMLSQNQYYDYYRWAELQVTFCFVSRIVPVMVNFMFQRQEAST